MAKQYVALYEETTRGTAPGSPTRRFLPIAKGLEPKFSAKDEPRKEFRAQDNALGDLTVLRKESSYGWSPEFAWYPGVEVGLILKHVFGYAGTRSVVDTSAYRGLLYPVAMPYGEGATLADKAIGVEANTDRDGTTKMQLFAGFRPFKKLTITFKAGEDVMISIDGGGAGDWVGSPNQTETGGASFPAALPFVYSDFSFYLGTGASRTGSAPNYTDIAPGTMKQFYPDELTITITPGLEDKMILNGVRGPSKTERTAQFLVEVDFTVDFRDPSSGFSSIDEYEAQFSGPRTTSLMLVGQTTELAGAATQKYKSVIDCPNMLNTMDPPDRDTDGKQQKIKAKLKSLFDSTCLYPVGLMTWDKASAY